MSSYQNLVAYPVEAYTGQLQNDFSAFALQEHDPHLATITIDGAPAPNDWHIIGTSLGMGLWHVQADIVRGFDEYMPDTATGENLERWSFSRVTRRASSAANGLVTVSGDPGAIVNSDQVFQDALGNTYTAMEAVVISADGTAMVPVMADVAGPEGNLAIGANLTVSGSPANIDITAFVASPGFAGGGGEESDDDLRVRIIARLGQLPSVGSDSDLENWARNHPTVRATRVWVFPVDITRDAFARVVFMTDETTPDGQPSPADEQAMLNHLQTQSPSDMRIMAGGPTNLIPLRFRIRMTPNALDVQAAVEAAIRGVIAQRARPGLPTSAPPGSDAVSFSLSWVTQAISNAVGEVAHELLSPTQDVELVGYALPTFGGIEWV